MSTIRNPYCNGKFLDDYTFRNVDVTTFTLLIICTGVQNTDLCLLRRGLRMRTNVELKNVKLLVVYEETMSKTTSKNQIYFKNTVIL